MKQISSISELRGWRANAARAGQRVALVPTMGALHEGHLKLVDAARKKADLVVMSIFVNPLQFRPGEDFERYPRNIEQDSAFADSRGVDLLFTPSVSEMYGAGDSLRIVAGEASTRWEGLSRPGHFDGVLTVVAKLFNIVSPEVAVFGQKDIQQVTLIRQMVTQLNFPVELCIVPIVREESGLAMSSRNAYLTPEQRSAATGISKALGELGKAWRRGETDSKALEGVARGVLNSFGGIEPEYIAVTEPTQLAPVEVVTEGAQVIIAARVGNTRLIDNVILTKGDA